MGIIVAKFGGTSVGTGERIRKAAQSVVDEFMKGNQLVVVVSAINKTTDESIKLVKESIGEQVTEKHLANILSMGEMQSVRIMAAAIESLGVKSEYIDPYSEYWPVITDSSYLNANINMEKTRGQIKYIKNLLDQGIIPVICGFIGRDCTNTITTLGRGGSDISAFLLGDCLNADEVIIVTDVNGVMSTDPRKVKSAKKLENITVEEMIDLANYGAQVLHPNALVYKDPDIKAKIIGFEHGNLTVNGTEIIGPSNSSRELITTTMYDGVLSVVAVVGEDLSSKKGVLSEVTSQLSKKNINICGLSTGERSLTIFFKKEVAKEAHKLLHEIVLKNDNLSGVSLGPSINMITVVSHDFIDNPGIISRITKPLHDNKINIVEISSSQTEVILYVDENDGQKTYDLIRRILK
ncbi:MAG: aspartate kinase [Methanobacteriaceae archaeon]|nr:aspartate kinase [Methanobacteriaceae archaeon]